MRKAEYKQIDTQTVSSTIMMDDYDPETGAVIGQHEETVTKGIPVMGMVYRDMTPEEIVEAERMAAEIPPPEPTPEERIASLENTTDDIILMMAELIGG